MATNRPNIKFNRTLLILLGILLACLLTLNAQSMYSTDLLSAPTTPTSVEQSAPKTIIEQIGKISFDSFIKKISSLK
ncbi:MAG: hypothetical protein ABJO91_13035 [Ekhidna sp.]